MPRLATLTSWIQMLYPNMPCTLTFAAADADFRRYFRATFADGNRLIVMDAPPEKMNTNAYVAVQSLLKSSINVPKIIARDVEQGFMALSDLGDTTLLKAFQHPDGQPLAVQRHLLRTAIKTLIKIQQIPSQCILPAYSPELLREEMNLFPDWFCEVELGLSLSTQQRVVFEATTQLVIDDACAQASVLVHRDFIVRNLMLTPPELSELGELGVLDFQDALYGPLTYDLASLLRDAFIEWEEEVVIDLCIYYWELAKKAGLPVADAFDEFYRQVEWMGVQRHLKVAGIFARLHHRDQKPHYLPEASRFIRYLKKTTRRYQKLHPLYTLLNALTGEDLDAVGDRVFSVQHISQ
ncbi:MAG: phosphotransferase [Neisseriaceae bacterium]|nr:phosphotransferase [Neisseriaceae bacterium]